MTRGTERTAADQLEDLANAAPDKAAVAADPIAELLLPGGLPGDSEGRARVLEMYKIMVQSSEALVARRQGTNTYFLTVNGVLLTATGLFIRPGADPRSHSAVIFVFCVTGLIISWAWRTLLVSFGQLNKGKFAVILRLERFLGTSIFDAEWAALGRGQDRRVYRSFTDSEGRIPLVFTAIYGLAAIIAAVVALGWHP